VQIFIFSHVAKAKFAVERGKNIFALKRHILGLAKPFSYYYPRRKDDYSLDCAGSPVNYYKELTSFAPIAQLVEQLICNQ
jgi:hypothetical protein